MLSKSHNILRGKKSPNPGIKNNIKTVVVKDIEFSDLKLNLNASKFLPHKFKIKMGISYFHRDIPALNHSETSLHSSFCAIAMLVKFQPSVLIIFYESNAIG